jgi:UDP-N-acetylglucosamine:LPS N-acetylglucosamine transferase
MLQVSRSLLSSISGYATSLDSLSKSASKERSMKDEGFEVNAVTECATEEIVKTDEANKGLKVLFLSSDTGGGHRASAEALATQFQLLYPGTTYILHDMVANEGTPPYSSLVNWYKHLGANPTQWKFVYEVSNTRAFEMLADAHLKVMCERAVRRRLMDIDPDVVISVHPLMCNVPVMSCAKISQKTGKHLPMFTVVTDLGSAHCLWFANGVEKMFVGSEQIRKLASIRGKVPDDKLVLSGLPIRHDFAVQAELLGDRMSPEGIAYQKSVREELELPFVDRKTMLVMGGGEGVGSLSNIVNALYAEFVYNGIDALILVVCGRNEKLKAELDAKDWDKVMEQHMLQKDAYGTGISLYNVDVCGTAAVATSPISSGCIQGSVASSIRKILSNGSLSLVDKPKAPSPVTLPTQEKTRDAMTASQEKTGEEGAPIADEQDSMAFNGSVQNENPQGKVAVVGLGFVTKMAEYMVAADILVSKAGPGTISEAAALSLPVMLTSFLPGQEEGNVDFVIDGGFGAFCSDRDPQGVGEELVLWLQDEKKLKLLSDAAKAKGAPNAAREIARTIGLSTLRWKAINEEKQMKEDEKAAEKASQKNVL